MSTVLNRYPLWKYILLAAIVLLGFLYAAPNLYPEVPAIQISGNGVAQVSAAQIPKLTKALQQAHIPYESVDQQDDKMIVRLKEADTALAAKEALQTAVGQDFTAAVNMIPATPAWLDALGGKPMKLGLDLRGGVHFLLQVDVDGLLQKRFQSDSRAIATALREANIRFSGIQQQTKGVSLQFRDESVLADAKNLLQQKFSDYQAIVPSQAPTALQLTLTPAAVSSIRDYALSQTMQVLNQRINALGIAEAVITRQGVDRVSVDMPGVQDTAQASQILGGNATLEMHLVNETADFSSAMQGIVPPGSSLYHSGDGRAIVLYNTVILTGDAITNATATFDQNARPAVDITATGSQIPEFHRITGQNIGHRMAIVLVNVRNTPTQVNGKTINKTSLEQTVISDAVIQSALPGSFQVTGLASPQMAKNLAIQLRSGTTPANLYPIQQLLVGPSLGQANINHGVISVMVGFLGIVIFMACYYRLFGLFADIALFMNLILTIALMSLIGFTLSLPGIAGMVLAVGMAVDANVLIFERIREELRNGTTVQAAIQAGYERAFSTIVDANVTTLIVAVILFALATSNVKAFAITLIIGLLTSMVTAIMGTRAMVNAVYGHRPVKTLSIGIRLE